MIFLTEKRKAVSEMPRYIDADGLIKKVFPYYVVDKKCYTINAKRIYEAIQEAPTADVVPKSEYIRQIAERQAAEEAIREIFEEIEEIIRKHDDRPKYNLILDLDKLKKKYVPDTNDGDIVKDPEHRCIYCQEIIPQGRDVCGRCEVGMDTLKKYNKNNNQGG